MPPGTSTAGRAGGPPLREARWSPKGGPDLPPPVRAGRSSGRGPDQMTG